MATDFDNYKNHKLDCILTFISGLEAPDYAIHSLKAIVLYDFFENQQIYDLYSDKTYSDILENQIPQIDFVNLSKFTTGIKYPEQLSRYINCFLVQLERINIPNFEAQLSIHNNLSDDYFETYSETVPLCDVLKLHGYEEQAELFTHEFLGKNTLNYFAYDIFSLRDRLQIPEKNDYPLQFFPNVPTFNEVFFNYRDTDTYSYTRYDYTKYISDWLYCRVTLSNWQRFDNPEFFTMLFSWRLEEELINAISNHAYNLYLQFVQKYFKAYYKTPFDKITDPDVKLKTANKIKDIIINLSIGDLSNIDSDYAKNKLKIIDIKFISNQLQNSNHISHHILSNINIHNPNSTVVADALILYKNHLNDYLNPKKNISNDQVLYDIVKFDTTEIKKSLSPDSTPEKMSFINEHVPIFDSYKSLFQIDGCITLGNNPIYALWLGVFLNDRNVLVKNHTTKLEERLDGTKYRDSYTQGFNDGSTYFHDIYKFTSAEFYANADSIVADLKHQYDNATCDFGFGAKGNNGWKVIKGSKCFIKISHKSINKFGYYSGIVSSLISLSEIYPKHFNDFFKSDLPLVPDYRFLIKTEDYFKNSSPYNLELYDWAVRQIKRNDYAQSKCIPGNIKFFTPHMAALLLTNTPIPVFNIDKKREPASIISKPYLDTYIAGYKEGVEFFNQNYSLVHNEEIKLLYAGKPDLYVNALKSQYFAKDIEDEATDNHWNFVTTKDLYLISHKEIKKYGFYSGIVGEVKSLIDKHSELFKDFYNTKPVTIENITSGTNDFASPDSSTIDNYKVNEVNEDNILTTKFESLKTSLYKYGFDKITFIDFLPVPKRDELITHLCNQSLNYQIAMLNYLDFIDYINENFCQTKDKRNRILSEILGVNSDNVRKCINSIVKASNDNRFFAINFAQDVKSYCLNLRNRA